MAPKNIMPHQIITKLHLDKAISYEIYRKIIDEALSQGKTTGPNQSEELTDYTKMNVQRMNRWDKTAHISTELHKALTSVSEKWIWLILSEGWCGDAAQNLPVIVKMAALNPNIEVKLLFRDENLDLMDNYLTEGARSIPKLICLKKETLEELGTWGPRPAIAQAMVMEYKKTMEHKELAEKIHKWYAENKSVELQTEFLDLVVSWMKV